MKVSKQNFSKWPIQFSDGCRVIDRKAMSCPLNIKLLQNVLERVIATSTKRVCLKKSKNNMWKNDIFQKEMKCPMLNILHKIFKYTIATFNENSNIAFTNNLS